MSSPEGPDYKHCMGLPPGHVLSDYELKRVLGVGGFGITYLATDKLLRTEVAIKELLPVDFAMRTGTGPVVAKSPAHEADFAWAKERFIEEARILSQLDHPNIVHVRRLLEANGTAYIVMDLLRGMSLADWRKKNPKPTEQQLMGFLLPLMDGLEFVHQKGLLHRDVSPENIFVTELKDQPKLLDFGNARVPRLPGQRQTSQVIIRQGYTPFEQYQTISSQGGFTDIYALAAVMRFLITGTCPPTAVDRAADPSQQKKLAVEFRGAYSQKFLAAIDAGMALRADDRPQSIAAWRKRFKGTGGPGDQLQPQPQKTSVFLLVAALVAFAAAAGAVAMMFSDPTPDPKPKKEEEKQEKKITEPEKKKVDAKKKEESTTHDPLLATKDLPYENTLGMLFVPLPGTQVLICIHETRRQDYRTYAAAQSKAGDAWKKPVLHEIPLPEGDDHPVVMVSWEDAAGENGFCPWLSAKEKLTYRLPSDREWSIAVGIGENEDETVEPTALNGRVPDVFPWGTQLPGNPPVDNLADESLVKLFKDKQVFAPGTEKYVDNQAMTSPVTMFPANELGIHGLGGNVQEWCGTMMNQVARTHVVRGGSWQTVPFQNDKSGKPAGNPALWSSARLPLRASAREADCGFRCVIELAQP